jgi:hypothetical protein
VRASLGCMTSPIDPAHIDSPDAATSRARISPQRRGWWSRMAPVLLLLLVAPLVAEFLLGDVTLALLGALVGVHSAVRRRRGFDQGGRTP